MNGYSDEDFYLHYVVDEQYDEKIGYWTYHLKVANIDPAVVLKGVVRHCNAQDLSVAVTGWEASSTSLGPIYEFWLRVEYREQGNSKQITALMDKGEQFWDTAVWVTEGPDVSDRNFEDTEEGRKMLLAVHGIHSVERTYIGEALVSTIREDFFDRYETVMFTSNGDQWQDEFHTHTMNQARKQHKKCVQWLREHEAGTVVIDGEVEVLELESGDS